MESPASWDLLTATLANCDLQEPERVWAYLVRHSMARDLPGDRERFVGIVRQCQGGLGEPGPSIGSLIAASMKNADIALPSGLVDDPWGEAAMRRLTARDPAETLVLSGAVPGLPANNQCAADIAVPGYVVGRKLAAGSLLVQYEAVADGPENRQVVVTMLQHAQDPECAAWFGRLVTSTAPLAHECIPRQLDAGETDGRPFVVTPAFPGEDLVRVVGRRGLTDADSS